MARVLRVGRDSGNEIHINDGSVSRVHAELVITEGGRYYLTDCASSWGTEVNRGDDWEKVTQTYIEEDTQLRLGRWEGMISDLMARAAPEASRASAAPRRSAPTMTGFSGVQGPDQS